MAGVIVLVWIVPLLLIHVSATTHKKCPGDLVWKQCASPCTKTCDNPDPFCIEVCRIGCECPSTAPIQRSETECITKERCCELKCLGQEKIPKEGTELTTCECVYPCQGVKCCDGQRCVSMAVPCKKEPCLPVAACVPSCDVIPCISQCLKDKLIAIRGTECTHCQCKEICDGYYCPDDKMCEPLQPRCIQGPCAPFPRCVDCDKDPCGFQCLDKGMVPVQGTECKGCSCKHVCDGVTCKADEKCVAEDVECVKAPCFPVSTCKKVCPVGDAIPDKTCSVGNDCKHGYNCLSGVCCLDVCDYGSPLADHFCGRGGTRCPDHYECAIAPDDRYAVCCPERKRTYSRERKRDSKKRKCSK